MLTILLDTTILILKTKPWYLKKLQALFCPSLQSLSKDMPVEVCSLFHTEQANRWACNLGTCSVA